MILYGKSPNGNNIIRILYCPTQSCVTLKRPYAKKNRFQTQFEKNLTGSLANEFKRTNLESILTYRVKRKLKHQLLA